MSVYSNSVRSSILDPVFFSQQRCEFRLTDRAMAYLPNMRLGNCGISLDAGVNNSYHMGAGVGCMVDRIRLMDGNEELDSLRNAGAWLTFKGLQKTNSQNNNVFTELAGGYLGWSTSARGDLFSAKTKTIRQGAPETLGTIDLRDVFPILTSLSHLSTKTFKNLRVVIEYQQKVQSLLNNVTVAGSAGLTRVTPILIVDEITSPALVATLEKQLVSAEWLAIEHDLVNIPAVPGIGATTPAATSVVQRNALRVNGFQGKAVSRMLITKNYTDPSLNVDVGVGVKGLGGFGSRALHKERFNLRLNGRNLMAGDGLITPSQTTMMLADVWGDLNMTPFSDTESVGLDSKYGLSMIQPSGLIGIPPNNWVGVNTTSPQIWKFGGTKEAVGQILTTTIVALGTTYAVGNTGNCTGGSGSGATYTIDTIGANGTVTGVTITDKGQDYLAGDILTLDGSGDSLATVSATTFVDTNAWETAPTAQQGHWAGNSSFIGLPIHDRISDIQLDLVRTGTNTEQTGAGTAAQVSPSSSAGNYQSMNVNIFAEVSKVLNISGGDWKISYA